MKAFLILEDGHVFKGTSIGSTRDVISEIVFNTSMTGYLEVMTDPSYAGQAVCMTYPLIGNYGICYDDQESSKPWVDGFIVRELSRVPSNFRSVDTIQHFLTKHDIPGIAGIDTRALTKILREKGTMNGMITVNENYDLDTIIPQLKAYTTGKVVEKVTCREKEILKGDGPKVALLDLGAKRNIARSLNERGCEVTIYPALTPAEEILEANPDGIMLSNGPGDPKECTSIIKEIKKLYDSEVPIFAICLGHQLMALATGGDTHKMKYGHRGGNHPVKDLATGRVYISSQNHGYVVDTDTLDPKVAKPAFVNVNDGTNEGLEYVGKNIFTVQFHPEVTHTVQGSVMLKRFVTDICHCKPDWVMGDYIAEAVEMIRKQTNGEEVILGLSGGVDSSVAAALIHRAIGDKLTCVFVDNGLLRKGEREQVRETFEKNMGLKLIVVDAVDRFMGELAGVTDPEQKRKIIGREFVNVFQEEAEKLSNAKWLAQGTIYPDVIESAGAKTKKAKTIKSHHNVGGLPETLHLKLLEPLRSLFKDEVRELGVELGLPYEMVYRHPFPGPGLGVRILGEVKREYADLLREADAIFIEELRRAGWYDKVSQAFVVFLPVKSVGVMGDGRTYDWVVSLRSVETSDFMTAKWSELPYSLLATVSNRIINEVKGINRVVYDVSGKPPATIEWE